MQKRPQQGVSLFVRVHPWLRALGMAQGVVARTPRAPDRRDLIELYSYEGCPACRRVRVALTELDLDYIHRSCPVGDVRNRDTVAKRGGRMRLPYLVDPATGTAMYESRSIVRYLQAEYGGQP